MLWFWTAVSLSQWMKYLTKGGQIGAQQKASLCLGVGGASRADVCVPCVLKPDRHPLFTRHLRVWLSLCGRGWGGHIAHACKVIALAKFPFLGCSGPVWGGASEACGQHVAWGSANACGTHCPLSQLRWRALHLWGALDGQSPSRRAEMPCAALEPGSSAVFLAAK